MESKPGEYRIFMDIKTGSTPLTTFSLAHRQTLLPVQADQTLLQAAPNGIE